MAGLVPALALGLVRGRVTVALCLLTILIGSRDAHAQGRAFPPPTLADDSITVVPSPRYQAGGLHRFLFGSDYRDLWLLPLRLPVLDIGAIADGLRPMREGGNLQSRTLHLEDAAGNRWVFRSLDKYPSEKLAPEVEDTWVGRMIDDQISASHPAGAQMVPPLAAALGILHAEPAPYVMPDDPRLGEFRETFAGMIGELEVRPNQGPGGSAGFAGSRRVVGADGLLERLEDSAANRVDERELLRARLLDFIVGDTDRNTGQFRWARFPDPDGGERFIWRPIPRDRDWAFFRTDGLLPGLVKRAVFPKLAVFGPEHSPLSAHTYGSHILDRRLLTTLDRAAFVDEVAVVQARLIDATIDSAVARLPTSYPRAHAEWVATSMRQRRDSLAGIADEFYAWLASDVNVRGTDEADRAEIVRHADGHVTVTLAARDSLAAESGDVDDGSAPDSALSGAYYQRTFLPSETNEVRVFLHGGDDIAVVRGAGPSAIAIRVIAGGGNDVLTDSSGTGRVYFYADRGENRFVRARGTRVDTRHWEEPRQTQGLRVDVGWAPDWGGLQQSLGGTVRYADASGFVVGAGPAWTAYRFRRVPYHWRVVARPLVGVSAPALGAEVVADHRLENSPHSIQTELRWSAFERFRWFGAGNDAPRVPDELALVRMERFSLEPVFVWRHGPSRAAQRYAVRWGDPTDDDDDDEEDAVGQIDELARQTSRLRKLRAELTAGPVLRWTRTDAEAEAPFTIERPVGADALWQAGARVGLLLERTDGLAAPRRGYRLSASAAGYPGVLDSDASANVLAELVSYVPLEQNGVHLALRSGAMHAFGAFPAFDAPSLGGRGTLRGFDYRRWAGEAGVYGSAELRAPITDIKLLLRGRLGAFALFDAGRVWVDGESPGGWHRAYGAGLWFEAFERALSVAFASGERDRLYLWLGLPF